MIREEQWSGRGRLAEARVALGAATLAAIVSLCMAASGCDDFRGSVCGDGICDPGEEGSCPEDCSSSICGDGLCQGQEDSVSCPQDCYCGDGVIDATEECEPLVHYDTTCLDLGCSGGRLDCDFALCVFDPSGCVGCGPRCGDGIVQQGEECDCGGNPENLPEGCEAVNGAGNCSLQCSLLSYCGDGEVDEGLGEECDCGEDPTELPVGCTATNGGPECNTDCTVPTQCKHSLWEVCDPQGEFECCPDPYGTDTECATDLSTPYCLLPCGDTVDCYFDSYCGIDGHCMPAYCGEGFPAGGQLNGSCQVPGGEQGVCVPLGAASMGLGICVEGGGVGQGGACDEPASLESTQHVRTQPWQRCESGVCRDGACENVCDWRDAYAGADPCPPSTNCLALSYFYTEDPLDPYDDDLDGVRWNDRAVCVTRSIDPQVGARTCDLVTGMLLDASGGCADLSSALWCLPHELATGALALGTPVGSCAEPDLPTSPVHRSVWEACDPAGDDVCPEGSLCRMEPSTAGTRCLPFCDTENDACSSNPQLPPTTVCVSLSAWQHPDDQSPSRLGMCVCPAGGC